MRILSAISRCVPWAWPFWIATHPPPSCRADPSSCPYRDSVDFSTGNRLEFSRVHPAARFVGARRVSTIPRYGQAVIHMRRPELRGQRLGFPVGSYRTALRCRGGSGRQELSCRDNSQHFDVLMPLSRGSNRVFRAKPPMQVRVFPRIRVPFDCDWFSHAPLSSIRRSTVSGT